MNNELARDVAERVPNPELRGKLAELVLSMAKKWEKSAEARTPETTVH